MIDLARMSGLEVERHRTLRIGAYGYYLGNVLPRVRERQVDLQCGRDFRRFFRQRFSQPSRVRIFENLAGLAVEQRTYRVDSGVRNELAPEMRPDIINDGGLHAAFHQEIRDAARCRRRGAAGTDDRVAFLRTAHASRRNGERRLGCDSQNDGYGAAERRFDRVFVADAVLERDDGRGWTEFSGKRPQRAQRVDSLYEQKDEIRAVQFARGPPHANRARWSVIDTQAAASFDLVECRTIAVEHRDFARGRQMVAEERSHCARADDADAHFALIHHGAL